MHRAALGRDPDASGLAALVAAHRNGAKLLDLARGLLATPEFEAVHGPVDADAPADPGFAAGIAARAFGPAGDPLTPALAAAAAGLKRAELLAAIAEAAPVRRRSPLLPGLFPDVPPDDPVAYEFWIAAYDTAPLDALSRITPLPGPRVSLAMRAGDGEIEAVLRTIASLQAQVHPDWQLCLACRLDSSWPQGAATMLDRTDSRITVIDLPPGTPAVAALNLALAARTGAVAGLIEPGDTLPPTALHEAMSALGPDTLLVFTDEDQADPAGRRTAPRFKPDYSADAMQAGDAIGQLALYRTELIAELGGLDPAAAPHEAYDLARRASATAGPHRIRHVPAVLCHRAMPPPPDPPAPPPPALPDSPPLVTVVMPTRNRADLLAASAWGVLRRTDYPATELIVVDNGSTDPAAVALLAEIDADPRAQVLPFPGAFNFSAMNNAAARRAKGEVLVLLNNDVELIDPGWLRALVAHAIRPDVGAVGARLQYRDGSLQHGGMVLGPAGRATHVLRGAPLDAPGYLGQLAATRELSAVTAACLAIRADVWAQVGGMNERLPVAWNDVDLCQRVRAAGLRVIWTPHAVLRHLEGETRGEDAADPARQARFLADQALYRATWGSAADEDPFLSPNLAATDHQLVLAPPRRRRPWDKACIKASEARKVANAGQIWFQLMNVTLLHRNGVLDQPLIETPAPSPCMADTLALLRNPALDPLFLRPALVGVESAWYGHVPFAHWVVAACRPRVVVELGTHNGVSYAAFCEAVAQYGIDARCYAVDTWQGDEHAGHYGGDVYGALRHFHDARYAGFSELLRCTFEQALPHFADGSIDLLHIDGFHTYDAVRGDFEAWRPKLSDRAVVLFHDTNERRGDFGVWCLWRELQAVHPGFEFLHSRGLGVLAVGPDAPDDVLALCRLSAMQSPAVSTVRERFALLGERWMDHFEQVHAIAAQQRAEARNAGYAHEVAALQGAQAAADRHAAEAARLTEQLATMDALRDEAAESRAELEDAWSAQAALTSQLAQRDVHVADLLAKLAAQAADWERVHQVLAARDAELVATSAALAVAESLQAATLRSASWRFAAPVRALDEYAPWFGQGLQRGLRLAGMAMSGQLAVRRRLQARRADEAAALRASPWFDAEFYLTSQPELAAVCRDPAAHYAWVGAQSGAMPNRYFATAWYLASNPAVAASGENPLLHWQREGAAYGLDPNPFLDVDWYSAQKPDAAGTGALTHWVQVGRAAGRDPNPMLDASALTLDHGDGPDFDPLLHWWRYGVVDGLNPHPLFDAAWYRKQYALAAGADPLAHWLQSGRAAGLPVSPDHAPGGGTPPAVAFPIEPAPDVSLPDVSIIVPVYGRYGDTLRCLQAVMLHSGSTLRFEVIVADDKPANRIAPLLRERVPGLRIIENAVNLGFLRSCNNAAGSALGRHIVFLNNDTTVRPGWLAPLVRLADADPLVGLVGCKLLNTDGTVQEAGGVMLRNGWGLPYGAGQDPDAPEYNFVRDVDVAIGACILVRREAFEQAGGFDDRYAPAFYEEFDLAFTLRDRGWRVVYQPASAVMHLDSSSYGAAARNRHSEANHARFCVKWARALLVQPMPNTPALHRRNRPTPAGIVLVIDDRVPEWDRNTGAVMLRQYLHLLQRMGYHVVFCPAIDAAPTQPYTALLQQDGIEVLHAPETLDRWLRANGRQLDLVWAARPDVTGPLLDLIRAETQAPVLYLTVDLHHLRERRRWELEGDPRALAESKRLKRIEDRIFARVDHVMTPSADEAVVIRADVPAAQVHVIPLYVLPAMPLAQPDPRFADRPALIFVGGYNHLPNIDAAVWLVEDIMPLVWAALPDVPLLLVGNGAPPAVEALASRRVNVTGFVPDLAPLYAQSRLSVNPLRYGAGVKGKIIASLQEGVPVITTPVGNEGLGLLHGTEAWVAGTAADFAAGIVALYQDPARCAAMAEAARVVLRREFSEDAARAALMGVLGHWTCRVCGRSAPARPSPCPHCGASAAAQGLASAILQGLPSGNGRSLADARPRLARLTIRVCDDTPPPLLSRLGCTAPDDAPCDLLVGGQALGPADARAALRPGARWIRPGRAEDAAALIAAGFEVLAYDGESPTLDARPTA